ncbi:MAG: response regulator [Bacteroidia bacterium]|nr:response regulator [Bacteroidia bacterium]
MEQLDMHQMMIVDDSEFMRRFLSKFLGKKLSLTLVADGVEALQKLHGGYRPNVILADINMPNLNGFEFLEHLQASPLYRSIPVIMLSSNDDSNDRIKSLRLGAVDYILKPFNPIELELRIEAQIQRISSK